ncbi:MAG: GC-type dockerin domain-anchored protein [Phycisphaerales bacterium]
MNPRWDRPSITLAASSAAALLLAIAAIARADDPCISWIDFKGDAIPRRTDVAGNGSISPSSTLPDIVRTTLGGWQSPTPSTDPYTGAFVSSSAADLFRLDVVFAGLVNPPGRLGDQGQGEYLPFEFGPSPIYGYFEIDMDSDRNTGGELTAANQRYLANVARFGRLPYGSIADRAPKLGSQIDADFFSTPQFERSGADFALSFCGCWGVTVLAEVGTQNGLFESGETWIVQGRFFQRSGGYRLASFMFGGSQPGLYDPPTKLRFSHNAAQNETTVTLVWALNAAGAGALAGQVPQAINYFAFDHVSVQEGLQDLIDYANTHTLSGPTAELADRWRGKNVSQSLDPTDWRVTALVGTAYTEPTDGPFVWTDSGFETAGDVNGDNFADALDRQEVQDFIDTNDAGPLDLESREYENGSVLVGNGGNAFCLFDVDADGRVGALDIRSYCFGDFNRDGLFNVIDFTTFATAYAAGSQRADVDRNGILNANDYVSFGNAFAAGCP